MKIGIVSDSHGLTQRLQRAIALLIERGAEALVHCGDMGSPECLAVLGQARVPAYAVVGNTDRDLELLRQQARACGVHLGVDSLRLPLAEGKCLAVTHGNDPKALAVLAEDAQVAYVCHGHTHRRRDERVGNARVINPGALHYAHPATVALLDTTADTVEFVEVR